MQHLTMEELARLVDEPAGEAEARHLAVCATCREELAEMEMQRAELRDLGSLSAPASEWGALSARLAAEGLIRAPSSRAAWRSGLIRMAAAIALFVSGGVTSELLRGAPSSASPGFPAVATTAEEAGEILAAREADYVAALTRYAELTGEDLTDDPVNRLAALEGIVLTTRAALRESPADPIINGYHLTALTQREAMLRQISNSGDGWY